MNNSEFIKALVIKPGQEPNLTLIRDDNETLNKIVDGLIQEVPMENDLSFIVNEEGKILGLPINRLSPGYEKTYDILCGNIIVVANDYKSGKYISLSDEQIQYAKDVFELKKHTDALNKIIKK